jgi:hypothetical protein
VQQKLLRMLVSSEERELEEIMAKGIRLGLGVSLLKKDRTREAADIFKALLAEDDRFVPAYIRLGGACGPRRHRGGDPHLAEGLRGDGSTEPLSALQNFYLRDEQPRKDRGVEAGPDAFGERRAASLLPGKLYYRLFMLDEALGQFQMCEDRVSGLSSLHLYIARILENQGKIGRAREDQDAGGRGRGTDDGLHLRRLRLPFLGMERALRQMPALGHRRAHIPVVAAPEPTIQPAPTWSIP